MMHCCEAPRSTLSNYFSKKQVLIGTFWEIWRIQIQMYLKTYVELKYGAGYLKNEVSAHRLGLVVQLSWRVAPPLMTKMFLRWRDFCFCEWESLRKCPNCWDTEVLLSGICLSASQSASRQGAHLGTCKLEDVFLFRNWRKEEYRTNDGCLLAVIENKNK